MLELSKPIADKLYKRGFTPEEIPKLLEDLSYLVKESRSCTTYDINQELENLGWGIQIFDESLFKEILQHFVSIDDTFKQN